MIIFMDTSAWIKYFIEEDGTQEIQNFILNNSGYKANIFTASAVTYAEMIATFQRAFKGKRITEDQYKKVIFYFKNQWNNFDIPEVDNHLIENSGLVAQKYALKGCDAFQLASALSIPAELFISSDDDLQHAANKSGFMTWNPLNGEYPKPQQ